MISDRCRALFSSVSRRTTHSFWTRLAALRFVNVLKMRYIFILLIKILSFIALRRVTRDRKNEQSSNRRTFRIFQGNDRRIHADFLFWLWLVHNPLVKYDFFFKSNPV